MATARNTSFMIPEALMNQVEFRAKANQRSRNAEFSYLLRLALADSPNADIDITVSDENRRVKVARIDYQDEKAIRLRCEVFQRSFSTEMVRLVAYGLKLKTEHELEIIRRMMLQQGKLAPEPLPPAQP